MNKLLCLLGFHDWVILRRWGTPYNLMVEICRKLSFCVEKLPCDFHSDRTLEQRVCIRCGKKDDQVKAMKDRICAFIENYESRKVMAERLWKETP